MLGELEIREPPEQSWVSLNAALTWIEFRHSLELEEMLEKLDDGQPMQEHPVRLCLQDAWRRMADDASVGRIEIRGRVIGDRGERALDRDELRNNRFLAWVQQLDNSFDVRVERHEDTYDGAWERLQDPLGSDLHHVVVRRDDLLLLSPVPPRSVRQRQVAAAEARRAGEWLNEQLRIRVSKSVTKRQLLNELHGLFAVSGSHANHLWREAALNHPEWSTPGPRKRSSRFESNHLKIAESITQE